VSPQKPAATAAKDEKIKKRFSIFGTGKKKEMEEIKNELQNMNSVIRTPVPTPQPNKSVYEQVALVLPNLYYFRNLRLFLQDGFLLQ